MQESKNDTFWPGIILVIGENCNGELGLTNNRNTDYLVNFTELNKNRNISNIYSGYKHTIYTNRNHTKLYATAASKILSPTKYFKRKNIKIDTIFTRPMSDSTIYLSAECKAYGSGSNTNRQLGVWNASDKPQFIESLFDPIDVQFGGEWGLALCQNHRAMTIIIKLWSRQISTKKKIISIPVDVINVIIAFNYIIRVYTTGEFGERSNVYDWREIKKLSELEIVKISAGINHALFLDHDGYVWICHQKTKFQSEQIDNLTTSYKYNETVRIPYFVTWKITVGEIRCGAYHNLCIDSNKKVWSWGYNSDGQCGDGTLNEKDVPLLIPALMEYDICDIDCGYWHSYVGTICGKHFLFGSNERNECIVGDAKDYPTKVTMPNFINQVIEKKYKEMRIRNVHLGFNNTKVVLVPN